MTDIDYRSTAVVIVGAGGHAQDIIGIASAGDDKSGSSVSILGFIDDNKTGDFILGKIKDYPKIVQQHEFHFKVRYVIGINSSLERQRIATIMNEMGAVPTNIIHKNAVIGYNIIMGRGIIMGPFTALTSNVTIGDHVHLNTSASINQGSKIGNFCTLSPGAKICGDVNMGECVSMGANSTVINLKNIGSYATIGAGAVVINDVEPATTVVGIPAKPISKEVSAT